MEFILRVQAHTPEEIHLHHKISFSGVDYDERYKEIPRKNFITVDAQPYIYWSSLLTRQP